MGKVNRTILFKISDKERIPAMLKAASTLKQDALKDGKPYILRFVAGPTVSNPRDDGYNYMIQATFASMEDMKYYDEECEAHKALKAAAAGAAAGPPLIVFHHEFVGEA